MKQSILIHSYKYQYEHYERTVQDLQYRFPDAIETENFQQIIRSLNYFKDLIMDLEKCDLKDDFEDLVFVINDEITTLFDTLALIDWEYIITPAKG